MPEVGTGSGVAIATFAVTRDRDERDPAANPGTDVLIADRS